jgi:hypothetical protein
MVARLRLSDAILEPATQPADSGRPRDIDFTDARARATIGWRPSRID